MRPYSITQRLITTVLLIELVAAVCVTAVALIYERHSHFHSFDVLLRGRADSMLGAVQDSEDANDNVMLDGSETAVPADDVYDVTDTGGRVLGRSANWPGVAAPGHSGGIQPEIHESRHTDEGAFFEATVGGKTYRVIRMQGLRVVDPGEQGGGIRRYVTVYYGSSVKRVWKAVLRAVGFYAISSVLVLACTGVLMSWLLNRGLAPLRELAAGAERVSVQSWSFTPPEEARMTKELAPLVSALETLLRGLQLSFEKQRRFVGDAAHELKTSVAVVKSSLQLLGMKQRSPEEYQSGLERCLTDCERMEAMVAQMLTLARVEESAPPEAGLCRADAALCLRDVTAALETMAEGKGIRILPGGDANVMIRAEAEQFKLLCTNLLMNALQHSPSGSEIYVDVRHENAVAEIRICDEGDGIAPEDLPRIFERFSRSDPSRSRKTGGTGLGLAISKAVVDRFGGSIAIESKLEVGTVVIVRLPVAETMEVSVTKFL